MIFKHAKYVKYPRERERETSSDMIYSFHIIIIEYIDIHMEYLVHMIWNINMQNICII